MADLGIQALLDDPSGTRIGIWQPGTFAGFGPVGTGRPGTPVWFQLHPTDYPDSVSFYRDAFGASGLRHHHRQLITARRLGGAGSGSAARRG